MKKALFSFIMLAFCMGIQAQEHLSFKGVPIDGTLQEYIQKMYEKGFICKSKKNGIAEMYGDFAGFKSCMIRVSTLNDKDLVNTITVIFPQRKNWTELMTDYNTLKTMLTEKYQKSSEVVEKFNRYVSSDFSKMTALKSGEIEWYTDFKTDLGLIKLSIISMPTIEGAVILKYFDNKNSKIIHDAAIEDL